MRSAESADLTAVTFALAFHDDPAWSWVFLPLARFGDVYFDNCVAGTQGGKLLPGGTGRLDPMYDVHANIAVPSAENDWLIKVEYTDKSP